MGTAIAVRADFSSQKLRPLATQVRDVAQARRLLVIAAVLDGAAREEAAKIGGMGWQTLRDWLIRFNDQGPDGLINKSSPGAPGKLSKRAQGVSRPPSGGRADPGDPSGGALAGVRPDYAAARGVRHLGLRRHGF
jgi:hypothetical protein